MDYGALLPRYLSMASSSAASSRKSLGESKLLPFLRMMEVTVFMGTFNAADVFWYPSPDLCLDIILSWSSTDNSREINIQFSDSSFGGHSCSQHANCMLPSKLVLCDKTAHFRVAFYCPQHKVHLF